MKNTQLTNFFFEIASLRRLTRSHRQFIAGVNDNVSDHSFRVTIIGMVLANLEGADENKVIKMALFHDVAEARISDANLVTQQYSDLHEEEARKDQAKALPMGEEILELLTEYEERETLEAVVTKDADILDQMILQQEYFYNDDKNRKIWQDHSQKSLQTDSAKQLAKQTREHNPFEWLYQVAEDKTGDKVKR